LSSAGNKWCKVRIEERPSNSRSERSRDGGASNPPATGSPTGSAGGGASAKPDIDTRAFWIGGAALLLAALVSVGYFNDPTPTPQPPPGVQAGASLLQPVAASDNDRAIGHLLMSAPDKDKVREDVSQGRLRLAWITLSDNFDEDGDWVRLEAGGFRQDVRLLHSPYQVAVPYLPGSPITVTGLIDGAGGNITVTVYVGAARVSLKPLAQGEVLSIPAP
jgi:hypothetical protein